MAFDFGKEGSTFCEKYCELMQKYTKNWESHTTSPWAHHPSWQMRGKGFVPVAAPDRVCKLGFLCLHWVLTFNKKYCELSQNKVKNWKATLSHLANAPSAGYCCFLGEVEGCWSRFSLGAEVSSWAHTKLSCLSKIMWANAKHNSLYLILAAVEDDCSGGSWFFWERGSPFCREGVNHLSCKIGNLHQENTRQHCK